jgi:hypothetical protein
MENTEWSRSGENGYQETLNAISMVALAYKLRGRWKEAEKLEVQIMETRKKVLGLEHPAALSSMSNLVCIYRDQGRLAKAEELDVQVMEAWKKVLGLEHPDTLVSMTNLAFTWKSQGRLDDALGLMHRCVQLQQRVSTRPALCSHLPRMSANSTCLTEFAGFLSLFKARFIVCR